MEKNYKNYKLHEDEEEVTLRGKYPEDIDLYLLSGEADDLSFEYFNE